MIIIIPVLQFVIFIDISEMVTVVIIIVMMFQERLYSDCKRGAFSA